MLHILKAHERALQLQLSIEGKYTAIQKHPVEGALRAIATVPPLKAGAAEILTHHGFSVVGDEFRVDQAEANGLVAAVNALHVRASDLRSALEHVMPEEELPGLLVKIPETQHLEDLSDLLGDLRLALDEPTSHILGERFEFGGFDRGTDWVLLLAPELVLLFVGHLLHLALWYTQQAAVVEQQSRIGSSRADIAEEVAKTIKAASEATRAILDNELRDRAGEVVAKHASRGGADAREEQTNLAVAAVKKLTELTQRQVEIHLTLTAPEPVKLAHPPAVQLINAAKIIRGYLTDGRNGEGESGEVEADVDRDDIEEERVD